MAKHFPVPLFKFGLQKVQFLCQNKTGGVSDKQLISKRFDKVTKVIHLKLHIFEFKRMPTSRDFPNPKKNEKMVRRDFRQTSSWLDQVKRAPSRGGSIKLQESMKLENSFIAQDNRPPVDLSEANLMTLKSPPKHHGMSQADIKNDNSLNKAIRI